MAVDLNNISDSTIEQLQRQFENAQSGVTTAKDEAKALLKKLNEFGYKDANNKVMTFGSLEEWKARFAAGVGPRPEIEAALGKLAKAEQTLKDIAPGFNLMDAFMPMAALKKMLESGDIEGAVMLLQTTRATGLEKQLGTEIKAMQARNAQITLLNTKLNEEQEKLGKIPSENNKDNNEARAAQQKVVSDIKTQIDSLNSESQVNMIRVQGLVNKRNEAFDMLTNLLGKFQKTIDGIVGNMR